MARTPFDMGDQADDPADSLAMLLAAQGIEPPPKGQRLAFSGATPPPGQVADIPASALMFGQSDVAGTPDPTGRQQLRDAFAAQQRGALGYSPEDVPPSPFGRSPPGTTPIYDPNAPPGPAPRPIPLPTTPVPSGGATGGILRGLRPWGRGEAPIEQNPPTRSVVPNQAEQGPTPGIPQPSTPAPQAAQTPGDTTATESPQDDSGDQGRGRYPTVEPVERGSKKPGGEVGPTGDNLSGLSKALSGLAGVIKPPPLQHLAPQTHLPGAPGVPQPHPIAVRPIGQQAGALTQALRQAAARRTLGELLRGR